MSYYKVLKTWKDCFEADQFINTVTEGNTDELDLSNKNIYGLALIIIDGGNETQNTTIWNVKLQCVDVITTTNEVSTSKFISNDNEQDVYNTMHNVLRRAFLKFVRDTQDLGVIINDNAPFQKVENTTNRVVGWEHSFTVQVPDLEIAIC